MSVEFQTSDPTRLLATFKKAIDEKHVVTWGYDKDGDFTHTADQWNKKAWMRPRVRNGVLAFFILRPNNSTVSEEVYAVYHGRLIESLVRHCDKLFSLGSATSMPTGDDQV